VAGDGERRQFVVSIDSKRADISAGALQEELQAALKGTGEEAVRVVEACHSSAQLLHASDVIRSQSAASGTSLGGYYSEQLSVWVVTASQATGDSLKAELGDLVEVRYGGASR
jgi:hypothetical protein